MSSERPGLHRATTTLRRTWVRRIEPWSAAKVAGAAIGFVVGGVAAFLLNLALGFAGRLELELEIE